MTVANWASTIMTPTLGYKLAYFTFSAASGDTVTISGISAIMGGCENYLDGFVSSGTANAPSLIYSGATIAVCEDGSYAGLVFGTA